MGVLLIICLLLVVILKQAPQYFYKTRTTEAIAGYPVNIRAAQQEYYAWHGNFSAEIKKTRGTQDQYLAITQDNSAEIQQFAYLGLPQTSYKLTLAHSHHSTIQPECTSKESIHVSLLPFICKQIEHYDK